MSQMHNGENKGCIIQLGDNSIVVLDTTYNLGL